VRDAAVRQPHGKHRALAQFACHGHVAAHHARELAGDGKAKAGAAEALRCRGINLGELLEHFCLLLRRHSDAGVGYCELDPVAVVNQPSRSQPNLACLVNLQALLNKLSRICRSRIGSAVSAPRSCGAFSRVPRNGTIQPIVGDAEGDS
jgi:hypothetical protein